MKLKKGLSFWIIIGGIMLIASGATLAVKAGFGNSAANDYQTVKIEKGDLSSAITTTGTLKLINSVQINSQITGKIVQVLVDYNQKVRKGQVLAILDTTLLKLAKEDAEGNLEKARNQLIQTQRSYSNTKLLFDRNFKSQDDLDTAENTYQNAKVALKSAQIALDKAEIDLNYAKITSPIDGIIIDKNAVVGQFVNISVSDTSLFVVSTDLSRMEVYATVSESDISRIKMGQKVNFSVQTYSGKIFSGKVRQLHLSPTVSQNVVNYTVVVDVENNKGLLFPGMTATVDLITESHPNVLKVLNSAFKYKPAANEVEKFDPPKNPPDAPKGKRDKAPAVEALKNASMLFMKDAKTGKLSPLLVKTGLNDGQMTEIIPAGPREEELVKEGIEIVSGKAAAKGQAPAKQNSLISPFGGDPMGPGPGPR